MFNGFIVSDAKLYTGTRTSEHFIIRTRKNEFSHTVGIQPHVVYTANVLIYPEWIEGSTFFNLLFSDIIFNTVWTDSHERILNIESLKKIASNYLHNGVVIIPEDAIVNLLFLLNRQINFLNHGECKSDYKRFVEILSDAFDNGGFIVITENTSPTPMESSLPIDIDDNDGGHYHQSFIF